MGFPWGRTEGQVVVEAEGIEFRQWMYIFSCDSGRGGEHKPMGTLIEKT